MARQGKRLIVVALGASVAWVASVHAQATADGTEIKTDAPSEPKPVGNPGQWFSADAYPVEAKRNGEEGTVRVGVDVDANGAPTGCSITESSGSSALDQGTCAIFLKHVRFRPGTDSKGRAISAAWSGSVTWMLEGNSADPRPIEVASGALTWSTTTQYTLNEQGNAVDCTSISVEGGIVDPCLSFTSGIRMGPPITKNGAAVRGRLTMTMSSKIEPLPLEQ